MADAGLVTPSTSTATPSAGTAEAQLLEMIESGRAVPADELMKLYEQLEPTTEDFMIGQWHGGKFDGGAEPSPISWYGKRFNNRDDVNPMLCTKPDGEIYAWDDWGQAQMREMAFGGKVQAALIYDKLPMYDYFRKVSDDTIIGLADIKDRAMDFFFWLRRDPEGKTHK